MEASVHPPLTIWCLLDGKAGHQNQTLGLAEAIGRRHSASIHEVVLSGWNRGLRSVFRQDVSALPSSTPDLIIGAGHTTHVPLNVFRRKYGGRSIVLMKPTLPLSLFDLCLVPSVHQLRRTPQNVVLTNGVLNRVLPGQSLDATRGMFLVGGPSSHFRWSSQRIARQIDSVIAGSDSTVKWTIATSRRTPEGFTQHLKRRSDEVKVKVVYPDDVDANWLPQQLATSGLIWVSEDSVSMTYEALTAGGQVGILELPRKRDSRVSRCIESLVAQDRVARWSKWTTSGLLPMHAGRFCEAERCATEVLRRLLVKSAATPDSRAA